MATQINVEERGTPTVTVFDLDNNDNQEAGNTGNEIKGRAQARRFTAKYKQKVLNELNKLSPGEIGQYLRQHRLYSSHITRWKKQAEAGDLSPRKIGRKQTRDYQGEKISQLTKKVARLEKDLYVAKAIIDVQKKLAVILGIELPEHKELN